MTAPSRFAGADARVDVEVDGPLDVFRTLRRTMLWMLGRCARRDGAAMWRAVRTPDGPATGHFAEVDRAGGRAVVHAWGPGAGWLVDHAADWLGAGDVSATWRPEDPRLARLAWQVRALRFGRTGLILDRLIPAILGQLVATESARRSYGELCTTHSDRAPGPVDLWLPPDPAHLAGLGAFRFVPCGVEAKRAIPIIEACRRRKRLEEAAAMAPADAARRLQALRGIGPWTAAVTIGVTHGDADAVPVGDYNLPHFVAYALAGEPRADDARMLELLEPFRPFRARAIEALKASGVKAPRYGPKLELRDIRQT